MPIAHLAIDLGASSGRAIVGVLEGSPKKLSLEEVHRFEHLACPTPTGPVWDLTGIWQHLLTGLSKATDWCQQNQVEIKTIGVDTWGVDWALLGPGGELLSLPHCYRDPQNEAACKRVLDRIGGFERLFERTGIQLMPFNTIFQITARYEQEPKLFEAASSFVFLPDLFHYWLSGKIATERTIASTSSILAVETGEWDYDLLEELGLPTHMLGTLVDPGTVLGTLRDEIAQSTGAPADLQVILPASHDTASAVAAVPATSKTDWAYLSTGTWSLLGAELKQPVTSESARKIPLTNERGASGTFRVLKNIAGLWLIQELRRELNQRGDQHTFAQLVEEARLAEPGRTLINPNHPEFAIPGRMQEKIKRFACDTDQPEPETLGQFVRCCLESLALCYAHTLAQLDVVLERSTQKLHLVGGGTQNALLNELTASALGQSITTGPIEATAIGNLLVQAMGYREIADLEELRQVVASSFPLNIVEPTGDDFDWHALRTRFAELVAVEQA